MTNYTINPGTRPGAIEIAFTAKPDAQTRDALKNLSFRWAPSRGVWYGFSDAATVENALQGRTVSTAPTVSAVPAVRRSLWDRVNVAEIGEHDRRADVKTIAAAVRNELKTRFPECRFSVRMGRGYSSIVARIEKSPYAMNTISGVPNAPDWRDRFDRREPSAPLAAVLTFADALLQSYNYDNSDSMTDYFDVNFYGRFEIADSYEQREPSETEAADVADFLRRKAEKEEADRIKQARRWEEEEREREKRAAEEKKRDEENRATVARIEAAARVVDLEEADALRVSGLIGGIGKECTIDEVREAWHDANENGKKYLLAVCDRAVYMTASDFADFGRLLMYGWSFLAGKGGIGTDDERVTPENYNRLNARQRDTVEWLMVNCVAVYADGKLAAVIDPEGFSYARYAYLPGDDCKIEKNADHIGTESAKVPFYFPAPLSEQAENVKPGDLVTVIRLDPWILTARHTVGIVGECTPTRYAQHDDALRVTVGKNTVYVYDGAPCLIYRGTLPEVPRDLRERDAGGRVELLYSGEHAENYMINIAAYYDGINAEKLLDNIQR